ncbi:MAG: hypothetical protein AB7G15_20130 [Alphaproteobacteria bacterium]
MAPYGIPNRSSPFLAAPRPLGLFVAAMIPTIVAPTLVVYTLAVGHSLGMPDATSQLPVGLVDQMVYSALFTTVTFTALVALFVYPASLIVSLALTALFAATMNRAGVARRGLFLLSAALFAIAVHGGILLATSLFRHGPVPALVIVVLAGAMGLAAGAALWPFHRAAGLQDVIGPQDGAPA